MTPLRLCCILRCRLLQFLHDSVIAHCAEWMNNGCESINFVLKSVAQWRPQKILELIKKLRHCGRPVHWGWQSDAWATGIGAKNTVRQALLGDGWMEENDRAAGLSLWPVLTSAVAVRHGDVVRQIIGRKTSATWRMKAVPAETANRWHDRTTKPTRTAKRQWIDIDVDFACRRLCDVL